MDTLSNEATAEVVLAEADEAGGPVDYDYVRDALLESLVDSTCRIAKLAAKGWSGFKLEPLSFTVNETLKVLAYGASDDTPEFFALVNLANSVSAALSQMDGESHSDIDLLTRPEVEDEEHKNEQDEQAGATQV